MRRVKTPVVVAIYQTKILRDFCEGVSRMISELYRSHKNTVAGIQEAQGFYEFWGRNIESHYIFTLKNPKEGVRRYKDFFPNVKSPKRYNNFL